MMLAIDASRAAREQKTGVGWYCHYLLAHLKDVIPPDQRVILYSDQLLPNELRPWPENWEEQILTWSLDIGHWSLRPPFWSQLRLAYQVLRDRPDVFFIPAHVIPELFRLRKLTGGAEGGSPTTRNRMSMVGVRSDRTRQFPKLITTIHDIVFKRFPETYSWRERWYADHATRLAVAYADRIIVPTQHVARELERWYGADRWRIAVVHHGVEYSNATNVDANAPNSKHSNGIRSIRMLPQRYILYVGRLERKKNVSRMVEAFSRVARQYPDLRLVLAGTPGYGYEEVRATIDQSPARDRIITLGWISREEHHRLLSGASVFLFPTLGEGFGLPILEAMAAGVPVITSRVSFRSVHAKEGGGAHEEVAGDAAVLVNPESVEEIADAIDRVLRDGDYHSECVRRGRQRAAQFTWKQAAEQTWETLRSVLSI